MLNSSSSKFAVLVFARRLSSSRLGAGVVDWSKPGQILSVEAKHSYRKNGFLLVRNVLSKSDIQFFTDRFLALCERKITPPTGMLIMKDVSIAKKETPDSVDTITKVQDFTEDELFKYCEHENITKIVRDLIGTPATNLQAMHTMLINKPPDTGSLTSRHPMHQDAYYFNWEPQDLTCCAWTAMEKVTQKNGCLQVVAGSHRNGLQPHAYPEWEGGVNKAYYAIKDYDMSLRRQYVEMNPGDTVFFHPYLYHGSGANRSGGFRKAISCHYANYDECRYFDAKGTLLEEAEKEIIEIMKKNPKRYKLAEGQKLNFERFWRNRSAPVGHSGRENL
ncbi:unnamed protein product [Caenorhabditis bovis]|uniref:phytanoyl-CoA dioxygenase n=1 Tax=Caenorhabditis bovis TaxID=2654633 RepID=A0A8S1F8A0_9PELO|nr:unnamed protein product [Caenorhabditis bovis]